MRPSKPTEANCLARDPLADETRLLVGLDNSPVDSANAKIHASQLRLAKFEAEHILVACVDIPAS